MIAKFYQRIRKINKMILVGEATVPDNRDYWLYPKHTEFEITVKDNPYLVTSDSPVFKEIKYNRFGSSDMFVADVEPEVK